MTFRIEQAIRAEATVFALVGEIDSEHIERLKKLLESEERPVLLDLADATLIGRAGVEFLARLETRGIGIVNCPDYVRRWIDAEIES